MTLRHALPALWAQGDAAGTTNSNAAAPRASSLGAGQNLWRVPSQGEPKAKYTAMRCAVHRLALTVIFAEFDARASEPTIRLSGGCSPRARLIDCLRPRRVSALGSCSKYHPDPKRLSSRPNHGEAAGRGVPRPAARPAQSISAPRSDPFAHPIIRAPNRRQRLAELTGSCSATAASWLTSVGCWLSRDFSGAAFSLSRTPFSTFLPVTSDSATAR